MEEENAKAKAADETVAAAEVVPADERALWAEMDEADAAKTATTGEADKPKDAEKPKEVVDAKAEESDSAEDAKAADAQVTAEETAAAKTDPKTKPAETAKGAKAAEATEGADAKSKATVKTVAPQLDETTLAALPEAVREHLKRVETENRSHRGRQSKLDRAEAELVTLRTENESLKKAAPAGDGKAPKAEDVAEWAQFEKDYPELATAIGKRFGTKIETLEARLAAAEGVTKGVTTKQTDDFIDQQIALVAEAHPDWTKVIGSPEFKAFAKNGPRRVREAYGRNFDAIVDGEEVEWLLTEFKGKAAPPNPQQQPSPPPNGGTSATKSSPLPPKRERQLAAAAAPAPGARTKVPQEGVPAELESDQAMWAALEKLDRAKGVGAGL